MVGSIHVITGPMRSNKTLDLILKGHDAFIARRRFVAFAPSESDRWGDSKEIVSRTTSIVMVDGELTKVAGGCVRLPAILLDRELTGAADFINSDVEVVLIDEAHFFSNSIVPFVARLRDIGLDVYVSGCDMDCFRQPYSQMPYLMAIADTVTKKTAVCERCGDPAVFSFRNTNEVEQDLVGDEQYSAVCLDCYLYFKDKAESQMYADTLEE